MISNMVLNSGNGQCEWKWSSLHSHGYLPYGHIPVLMDLCHKKIQVTYIPTDDNVSDIFTKALAKNKFHRFIELLGLCLIAKQTWHVIWMGVRMLLHSFAQVRSTHSSLTWSEWVDKHHMTFILYIRSLEGECWGYTSVAHIPI